MKNSEISFIFIGILILITIVIAVGCRSFFSNPSPPAQRKIAGNVKINSEWEKIIPDTSLEAVNKIQFIGLKIDNLKGWKDSEQEQLLLNDGTELTIEVQLIDEKGQITNLYPNGISEFAEFGKRTKDKTRIEDSYFQVGEKFKEIRIRSDKQILVKEIVWSEFKF
jgi:hypothetical protein